MSVEETPWAEQQIRRLSSVNQTLDHIQTIREEIRDLEYSLIRLQTQIAQDMFWMDRQGQLSALVDAEDESS